MGDSHWVAMAGGFQLVGLAVLAGWAVLASCAPLAPVQLATFDGASGSTHKWEAVSDPVMGGQSYANFRQAPGLGHRDQFPDCSGTSDLVIRARAVGGGLTNYNAMLITSGSKHGFKTANYLANYSLPATGWGPIRVPWSAFKCSWRGEPVSWCPALESQLDKITNIGVGTAFPGAAGKFHVEIESISAE